MYNYLINIRATSQAMLLVKWVTPNWRPSPILVKIAISLLCFLAVFWFIPTQDILNHISSIHITSYITAFILIFCNLALSSVRLNLLASEIDLKLGIRDIHKINIFSQLVGLFAFQAIGQLVFRSLYGAKFTDKSEYFSFLTFMEKVIAMLTLLGLAIVGAYLVLPTLSISIEIGSPMVVLVCTIFSIICVYRFVITSTQRRYILKIVKSLFGFSTVLATALTLVMHLLMLGAYVVLGASLAPDVSLIMLSGIFCVVMLGAAVPISFAGWGLRELSSGVVFAYLGLGAEIGVIAAIIVGFTSIFALTTHGLILKFTDSALSTGPVKTEQTTQNKKEHFQRAAIFFTAILVPIFIGMQLKLPTQQGLISFNLADPIAIVASVTFIALIFSNFKSTPVWRIKGLPIALGCFALMIIYGWTIGYLRVGFSDWATYNRLIGILVVFSYLLAGAFIGRYSSSWASATVIKSFVSATAVILIAYLFIQPVIDGQLAGSMGWVATQFNGLMTNRNALAFILCLLLCLQLSHPRLTDNIKGNFLTGLILSFIVLTLSRTGIACAAVILVLSALLKQQNIKQLAYAFAATIAILLIIEIQRYFYPFELSNTLFSSSKVSNGQLGAIATNPWLLVHSDRFFSYVWAWEMWTDNLFLGAGLGAFISTYKSDFHIPLTIHNTFLWIAAEMGIVGILLFLPLPACIILHLKKHVRKNADWSDISILLVVVTFVLFSMTHEVLYQRIFWFLAGLLCVRQASFRKATG